MKKTLVFSGVTLTVILLFGYGAFLVDQARKEKDPKAQEKIQLARLKIDFEGQLAKARTSELVELEKDLKTMPAEEQKKYQPLIDVMLAQRYYDLAEEKIFLAKSILEATASSQDGINPIAQQYIREAFDYYKKAKSKIDGLQKIEGQDNYNFHMYYARGNIYFRLLLFISTPEDAMEFFNQTALAWREALNFKEKDIDTEINLEFLSIKQSELLAGANRSQPERIKLLPNTGIGRGKVHGVH